MPLFSRNAFRHRFLESLVSLGFWLLRCERTDFLYQAE